MSNQGEPQKHQQRYNKFTRQNILEAQLDNNEK